MNKIMKTGLEEQETFSSLIAKQNKIEFKTIKIAKNNN